MAGGINRRHLVGGAILGSIAAGSLQAGALAQASPVVGGWAYTDFLGRIVTTPETPSRIAAEIGSAAALYDMGVQVHSVWGYPANDPEGYAEAWGRLPTDSVVNISTSDGEIDFELAVAEGTDLFIFGSTELENPESYGGFDDIAGIVQGIAPIAAWPFLDRLDKTTDAIWDLAIALGADPESETNVAARADLDLKVAELQAITTAKPGLTTFFGYPTTDELYVANPALWDDVNYFKYLGLAVVDLDSAFGTEWWEVLSWEEALKYSTDTAFLANVSGALTLEELQEHPTFQLHPALQANQVGAWSWYFARSPQGIAGLIDNVLQVIRTAEKVAEE